MARSHFSPSPSPGFESESRFSDSSLDEELLIPDTASGIIPAQGVEPVAANSEENGGQAPPELEVLDCQWDECTRQYNHLPTMIEHIHNDHIGVHKSNYTCEWRTCLRRGIAQTSRFALISHIRSHTGEKPFICPKPECDKSFTRSDALAKHMRIQHNIIPPLPGRGGNRKRKREPEQSDTSHAHPIADGYSTAMFRVDQQVPVLDTHSELDIINRGSPLEPNPHLDYYHNGLSVRRSLSPEVNIEGEDDDDDLPPHLAALLDPTTGLIMGRSPAFVKYIVWKAKHKHVLREHEDLIEQLRSVRWEEKCWRQRKDALLDEVLRVTFGDAAEELTMPPLTPPTVTPGGGGERQEGPSTSEQSERELAP